jgi:hypothetical protein
MVAGAGPAGAVMAELWSCFQAKAGAGPPRELRLVQVNESTNMLLLMVAAAAPLERGRPL